MQNVAKLHSLFNCNIYSSSKIIFYDGVKKDFSSFSELQKCAYNIKEIIDELRSIKSTICILIKQELALPAVVLGVLETGASFAVLDVDKPCESLSEFQRYVQITTILVQGCYLKLLESKLCSCWKKINQFYFHSEFYILESTECKNDVCLNSKEYQKCEKDSEIAYVIQTSGTTGEPKIVKVPHDCIVSNILDLRSRFSVSTHDVILQSTRITFDPSIIEIFLSLSSGATLVMVADHIRLVPRKLLEVMTENHVTILQGTPSLICNFGEKALKDVLLHEQSDLRILAFGGEICPSWNKLKKWKSEGNNTEIYNLYGLTEVSCWATCFKIDFQTKEELPNIPIGDPLLNTKLEIYNENKELASKGELFIGGKRFCLVNNEKWPENSNDFMRPSGDLVYQTSNGLMYFEGRIDSIIKYKGHKISLQLVKNYVELFPEVSNVLIYYDPSSTKLYLFIVLNSGNCCESEVLIKALKKSISNLPVIVVVPVPFIPLTKHGKGDVSKLMNIANKKKENFFNGDPIHKNLEETISSLWKDYTNQITIKDSDNFILSGGDSFNAVRFASEIEWHFQLTLPELVEKTLNESFKDVNLYVEVCLKEKYQPNVLNEKNLHSVESSCQSLLKKKRSEVIKCFKRMCKQGYYEHCTHVKNSNCCFGQKSQSNQKEFNLNLVLKWNLKKCIDATPCIFYSSELNQHLIFIGSHFGMFSCIHFEDRSEKWQILVPDRIESSACISACGNFVLFGCYDYHLYCVSIADGNIYWKYKTGAEVKSSPCVSVNNIVYVGSHDKHVYAIDVESGLLLWKKQVAYGSIFSSPAVIETLNAVCIGTLDGVLALLKMDSGDYIWKYISGKPFFSSPVTTSNYILVGSTDKYFLCLNLEGKEVFKFPTNEPIFSSATILYNNKEERILFGCHDCYVYCITLKGELEWKVLCDSKVYVTPCYFKYDDYFYICVASTKGTLYVLQSDDGKEILSRTLPGDIFSSPVILDNILTVGCRDNNIYCFSLNDDEGEHISRS